MVGGLISGSVYNFETVVLAFGIGGIANVVGRGITDVVKHIKISNRVNEIYSEASKIASLNSKNKSLAIWEMLGADSFSRNSFKSMDVDDIFLLLMSEGSRSLSISSLSNLTRYAIYSSIFSSLISGWF